MAESKFLSELWHVSANEFKQVSIAQKSWLGATACALVLDWGTFNEGIIGYVAGGMMRQAYNVATTAGIAGCVSFVEQCVFGLTTVVSIHNFPKIMSVVRSKLNPIASDAAQETPPKTTPISNNAEPKRPKPWKTTITKAGSRFIDAFSLGTSVKAIKESATTERSLHEDSKTVVADAAIIGSGVVGIDAAAAAATSLGRSTGLETEANVLVDIISSPFTYLGLFGLKVASNLYKKHKATPLQLTTADNPVHIFPALNPRDLPKHSQPRLFL